MTKLQLSVQYVLQLLLIQGFAEWCYSAKHYTEERKIQLREQVRAMFQHAYNGYLEHAADYDELRPLSCDGHDTWGSYSLTLIDALDTLATMGNYTEFRRVVELLDQKMDFDKDINVSVFETNIRIVGGLLSAHLLSKRAGVVLELGWPCQGPLLRMAENVARRLLPAFETATGMPYGTVNLRHGVPKGETTITCTACTSTFIVEFGALSRLTGNPIYEDVALFAIYSLWQHRSEIGLFGNHIDVQTGRWTAIDSGIGAGVDSLFEYLVKGALLFNRPDLLKLFHEARAPIDKFLRKDDWYIWANMNSGFVTLPVFQSLDSFWPGLLSIIGDIKPAMQTIARYSSVLEKYGFLPEFFNVQSGQAITNREVYPLRPELIESAVYLYRATKNEFLLELGERMLETIEFSARTRCGYATIRNVRTHEKENRMESFFLAETTKYLYLLFDEHNFLHNNGENGVQINTPNGQCIVNAGAYVFNTEAHPIDMSALYCCHDIKDDIFANANMELFKEQNIPRREKEERTVKENEYISKNCAKTSKETSTNNSAHYTFVDINILDIDGKPADHILVHNFEQVRMEAKQMTIQSGAVTLNRNQLTFTALETQLKRQRQDFASIEELYIELFHFMNNYTMDTAFINGILALDKTITDVLHSSAEREYTSRMRTLWELYEMEGRLRACAELITSIDEYLVREAHIRQKQLEYALEVLDQLKPIENVNIINNRHFFGIWKAIYDAHDRYKQHLTNVTSIQNFLVKIYIKGSESELQKSFTSLLNEETPNTLNSFLQHFTMKPEVVFSYVRAHIAYRKRFTDALVDLLNENSTDQYVLDVVELLEKASKSTQSTSQYADNGRTVIEKETQKQSLWSQFLGNVLRITNMQRSAEFDESKLLQRAQRMLRSFENKSMPYELFYCERPYFVHNLAYRDYYPDIQ